MTESRVTVRALCLLSGGLDSQLSVCVLRAQGIDVHAVVFESPFFEIGAARQAAEALKIPLRVLDFTQDIIELVMNPPHGFGSCINPCIDCHARMLKRAGQLLEPMDAKFLATGEVLNERPMSQNRNSLNIVANDSGFANRIVRPLSAQLLEESYPEKMGWVDRSRLLSLNGRSRKPQMALAVQYGLTEYPSPAGGCRLTEPNYAKRLADLKSHEGLGDLAAIRLLRIGRQFRLSNGFKVIVGRNKADNATLESMARPTDLLLKLESMPGPTVLVPACDDENLLVSAAALCARYGDCPKSIPAKVRVRAGDGTVRIIQALPAQPSETDGCML